MHVDQKRYTRVAVTLHWVMAIAFLLMLASGASFSLIDMPREFKFNLYQWHKSLGVLLLCAFFLRIAWRVFHKPPAMPQSVHGIERIAAHAGHWALYALMIMMPISGWVMVSSSVYGLPTVVFGWFEWPHLPDLAGNEAVSNMAKAAHYWLAIAFAFMIAIHVPAVIKHAVCEKENLLPRMWFGRASKMLVPVMLASIMAASVQAHDYAVDKTISTIGFSGQHAGKDFTGRFDTWDATIVFDPDHLDASHIRAVLDVSSAQTGNKMYDGALPQGDWLDAKNHPQAVFETTAMTSVAEGRYQATGHLTLRGVTHPVTFDFTLSDLSKDTVTATGQLVLKRLDYGIGQKSDPKAEWVSEEIGVTFDIIAARVE